MLGLLFRRLTSPPRRGTALIALAIRESRAPAWFTDGGVPDTLDGRFAALATVTALILVRLERDGEAGDRVSVALTERFIETMEAEHRELGLGDPTLGKTVRRLVGSLARRVERWRVALDQSDWREGARASLYKADPDEAALELSAQRLEDFWRRLDSAPLAEIEQGRIA